MPLGSVWDSGVTSLHLCEKLVQALSPSTESGEETLPAGLGSRVVTGRPPKTPTLVTPWSSGIPSPGNSDLLILGVQMWLGQATRQTIGSRKL